MISGDDASGQDVLRRHGDDVAHRCDGARLVGGTTMRPCLCTDKPIAIPPPPSSHLRRVDARHATLYLYPRHQNGPATTHTLQPQVGTCTKHSPSPASTGVRLAQINLIPNPQEQRPGPLRRSTTRAVGPTRRRPSYHTPPPQPRKPGNVAAAQCQRAISAGAHLDW